MLATQEVEVHEYCVRDGVRCTKADECFSCTGYCRVPLQKD